jgi:hypothetical protein
MTNHKKASPAREMLGVIYWPNGMGETQCTSEYEEAVSSALNARRAADEYESTCNFSDRAMVTEFSRLDHAAYAAQGKVDQLILDCGHIGERIRYDDADPMTALLGGGTINIMPGGGMKVAG